jgi:hypothetical protein
MAPQISIVLPELTPEILADPGTKINSPRWRGQVVGKIKLEKLMRGRRQGCRPTDLKTNAEFSFQQ